MRLKLFILLSIGFGVLNAQSNDCYKVTDKKAIKNFEKARDEMRINPGGAVKMFKEEVLTRDPDYIQVHYILAEYYFGKLNESKAGPGQINKKAAHEKAIYHLKEVHRICPNFLGHVAAWKLGVEYDILGEREKSIEYFTYYLEHEAEKPKEKEDVARRCNDRNKDVLEVLANPVKYDPFKVKGINTERDEYLPMLSPDNDFIYFTRKSIGKRNKNDLTAGTNGYYEEFLSARKMNVDSFSSGFPVPCDINEPDFYLDGYRVDGLGGVTITPDNKHIFVTVILVAPTSRGQGVPHADIYYADYKNNKWTDFRPLLAVNNENGWTWEGQPTISSDGNTIIFASARDSSTQFDHPIYGPIASMDLFETHRTSDGKWSYPKNLGTTINTKGQEKTPFLHTDSKTLYFASNGHPGVGGYDLFYSRQDKFGNWSTPKNLGVPINDEFDQHGFIVSLDGKYGFLTNGKEGDTQTGGLDIISFDMPERARPQKLVFVTGKLKTEENQPIEDALVEIKNTKTGEITEAMVDKETGEYVAILTVEDEKEVIEVNGEKKEVSKKDQEPTDFILTAKKEDHAFSSTVVTADPKEIDGAKKARGKDIQVDPIKVGKPYRINDIQFATGSYEINHRTMLILDGFIEFLEANPKVTVAIHGHTDNQGNANENLLLSENRAKAVHDYLVINDIDPSRLSYKGFGSQKPMASNATAEGRAKNRRTEFVILTK